MLLPPSAQLNRELVVKGKVINSPRLVKTPGCLIKHAPYFWSLLAESHLTRRLFGGMLRAIVTLPVPAG